MKIRRIIGRVFIGFVAVVLAFIIYIDPFYAVWREPDPLHITEEEHEKLREQMKAKGIKLDPRTYAEWDEWCKGNDVPICDDVHKGKYPGSKWALEGRKRPPAWKMTLAEWGWIGEP